MKIKITELEKLVISTLVKKYSKKEAQLIADVILFGQLSGKTSHGVIRLITGSSSVMSQNPTRKPEIIKKTNISSLIDAHGNPGMLVASLATQEAIKIGKRNKIVVVGTKGTYSTSGSLSYYLEKIGKEDLIGIIMARSSQSIAPFGSIEPLFGTNPIGWVLPANPRPFIFDMGTSAISYGALLRADEVGEKLPDNVAINKAGKITKDPKDAMRGALLAFDRSYKGSGLAMIVEAFAGVMTGAGFADLKKNDEWGNIFIVISPNLLVTLKEFKHNMNLLVERVRNAQTQDGSKVRIPGEKTFEIRNMTLKKGVVDVDDTLLYKIQGYSKS